VNLPFYIARRFLFSKKKHNAIDIISAISVCGVALATMAMVCTLSVFNGFQDTVADLFTVSHPELKVTIADGNVFDAQAPRIHAIRQIPEVNMLT
jgi:ABC-type transport system, involved in lipoprotein release, permease component